MNKPTESKKITKRAITAYTGAIGMVAFASAISIGHGAGFKPLLILLPLFLFVFGGITYQFFKELRALKQNESKDKL